MDHAFAPTTDSGERRQAARVPVAAVAVLNRATQPPSICRVTDLSIGGLGLIGDAALGTGRQSLILHVAGFPALDLQAMTLRCQLAPHRRQCAVRFVDVTRQQLDALSAIVAADHSPVHGAHRAVVVAPNGARAEHLGAELQQLGYSVRHEASPGQALAWLQREDTEALLLDESMLATDRWNLLQFVRDAAPEVRRFVIASDVRGFRLYYAIKAGLVEALVDPSATGDGLARHLTAASTSASSRRRQTRRRRP
jgi:CheY-like chemotaxis protein